nr:uncharacterized protein [Tanacetum cinerariifolium]
MEMALLIFTGWLPSSPPPYVNELLISTANYERWLPSSPPPYVNELLISTANYESNLESWNIRYAEMGNTIIIAAIYGLCE